MKYKTVVWVTRFEKFAIVKYKIKKLNSYISLSVMKTDRYRVFARRFENYRKRHTCVVNTTHVVRHKCGICGRLEIESSEVYLKFF